MTEKEIKKLFKDLNRFLYSRNYYEFDNIEILRLDQFYNLDKMEINETYLIKRKRGINK